MSHLICHNSQCSLLPARLVWRGVEHGPGESGGDPRVDAALKKLKTKTNEGKVPATTGLKDHAARVAQGHTSEYEPDRVEKRDKTKPINPAFREAIVKDLQEIYKTEFRDKHSSLETQPGYEKYYRILDDVTDGLTMQAIVEGGSEEELEKRYRAAVEGLENAIASNSDSWDMDTAPWKPVGPNPNLLPHKINTLKNKRFVREKLKELEQYYKERLEKKYHVTLGSNKYDSNVVDFLTTTAFPFYRELHMDQTIINKENGQQLIENYSEFLKVEFRGCIKDPHEKDDQEVQDKTREKMEREASSQWTRIRDTTMDWLK